MNIDFCQLTFWNNCFSDHFNFQRKWSVYHCNWICEEIINRQMSEKHIELQTDHVYSKYILLSDCQRKKKNIDWDILVSTNIVWTNFSKSYRVYYNSWGDNFCRFGVKFEKKNEEKSSLMKSSHLFTHGNWANIGFNWIFETIRLQHHLNCVRPRIKNKLFFL